MSCHSCNLRSLCVDAKAFSKSCCDPLIHHLCPHPHPTPPSPTHIHTQNPPPLSPLLTLLWQSAPCSFSDLSVMAVEKGQLKCPRSLRRLHFAKKCVLGKKRPFICWFCLALATGGNGATESFKQKEGSCGRTLVSLFHSIPGMYVVQF